MRISFGLFFDIERDHPAEPREIDIPGSATERLPEFEEGVQGPEARRRVGFQA